ncbi:hypothetical protein FACS1894164_03550 [Spirochaetia bacterium]|nr:hypothetical protein FACS1894164_03550 [Spirochaetia bacterium]
MTSPRKLVHWQKKLPLSNPELLALKLPEPADNNRKQELLNPEPADNNQEPELQALKLPEPVGNNQELELLNPVLLIHRIWLLWMKQ